MQLRHVLSVIGVAMLAGLSSPTTLAHDKEETHLRARLVGIQEVPALSTTGHGRFMATVNEDDSAMTYELSFADLEGTVQQSHIHIGQFSVSGGIMLWLCGTSGFPGPAGTPTCPAAGMVSRTVTAADVIGPMGQGIEPAALAEFLQAIRRGVAYANVHSSRWPGGEIRGQIDTVRHHDD